MFDTYVTRREPHYPQTINKHEHRAPTDDSVKLLREMEEKARDQVVESYRFKADNDFVNGHVIVTKRMDNKHFGCVLDVYIVFNLNGKEYKITEKFDEGDFRYKDKMEAWRLLLTKVSQAVTQQLIPQISDGTIQSGFLK